MKIKKILCYILTFLPLVVTMIALPFLPEQIPAHYGMDNQVTRWGSKYEALIVPAITIVFGIFMLMLTKYTAKKEKDGKNNEKATLTAAIIALVIFNMLSFFFLYTDFNKIENLSLIPLNIDRLTFAGWGILMIILGNVMPKLRMNSIIGLRTKWSMKNETAWKKSQFCGGISFIAAGVIILIICILAKNIDYLMWVTGILAVLIVIDVWMTYKIAQKY